MKRSAPILSLTLSLPIFALWLLACGKNAGPDAQTTDAKANVDEAPDEGPPPPPALSQAQLEELYVASRTRWEATTNLPDEAFAELQADLRRVANEAQDAHLRANASLLLGGMHEQRGDQRSAISYYRQAQELIPDEVETHIVLALALAKAERWDEAIAEQWQVVEAIPDDLIGWLLLGELHVKGGKLDEAAKVYGAYELRRKGLIDGLTAARDGEYLEDEAERAACAEALTPAIDNGTALALMYALDSDPSPVVRERVAAIMGEQRLIGYQKLLEHKRESESDEAVNKAIDWALAEIEREPVETAPGPVPEEIREQVEAEVAAQKGAVEAEKAPEGDEAGESETGESAETPPPSDDPGKDG